MVIATPSKPTVDALDPIRLIPIEPLPLVDRTVVDRSSTPARPALDRRPGREQGESVRDSDLPSTEFMRTLGSLVGSWDMTCSPKTQSTDSTDAKATREDRDGMFVAAVEALMPIRYRWPFPSAEQIGQVVAASICISAWRARGSIASAAALAGASPSEFLEQIRQSLLYIGHQLVEHDPLDDSLFPLVCVRWTSPEPEFLHEYVTWMADDVLPRAHAEDTRIVMLHNLYGVLLTPPGDFVTALADKVGSATATAALRGSVVLASDHLDMRSILAPADASRGARGPAGVLRFAEQPDAAFDHAIEMLAATPAHPSPPGLD
ncbi:MAG: hypothetical protein AAGF11_45115 [Myxococcota bacterium]